MVPKWHATDHCFHASSLKLAFFLIQIRRQAAFIFYFLILRLSGGCGGNIYFYFLRQNRGATALQMGVWGAKKFLLLF